MKLRSKDAGLMNRPASPLAVFLVTVVAAATVAWLLMDLPRPESDLPWPGLIRDVVYEQQAVDAALGHSEAPNDHARTPGALFLLTPLALVPPDWLTVAASIVSILSLGMVAAGTVRIRRPSFGLSLCLAVALPVSVAFIQAVFHGSTFLPFAACLVWTWVFLREGRPVVAGALLAVAAVSRLWPLLLIAVLARRRQWAALTSALALASAFTALGLSLPGITVRESVASVVDGGEGWINAEHNGSVASWLVALGPLPAAVIGLGLVLGVWWIGLRRSRSLDSDISWTLVAAVLASPLAWLPYLLALTPLTLVRPRSRLTAGVLVSIAFIQLVGYRLMSQQVSMTLTLLLCGCLCWNEWLGDEGASEMTESGRVDIGNVLKEEMLQPMGHWLRSR